MIKLGILSLIGLLMIGSCKRENSVAGIVLEADFHLYVVDEKGNNLLKDNEFVNGLKLFYIVNGKEVEVYDPDMTAERNFFIFKFDGAGKYKGEPIMRVFANTADQGNVTKTLLKWGNSTVDTLTTELTRKGANLWIKNIWLNGGLIWTPEIGRQKYENGETNEVPKLIEVVK